jgi:hypothetical protein
MKQRRSGKQGKSYFLAGGYSRLISLIVKLIRPLRSRFNVNATPTSRLNQEYYLDWQRYHTNLDT